MNLTERILELIKDVFSPYVYLGLGLILVMALGGCVSRVKEIRENNVRQYQKILAERTQKNIQPDQKLRLQDCIELALQNNLKGQASEIQARIKKLERKVAFGNFFPALEINANYTAWERQPKQRVAPGQYHPMHDKEISEFVVQAQMPIFIPATWYLYSLYTRGAEIGDLILDYTRRMVSYQVSAMYYQCLILQEMSEAMESQVIAGDALEKEVASYEEEGLVNGWQAKQAQTHALARHLTLNRTRRAFRQAKADLLSTMGLSPMSADLTLVREVTLEAPKEALEELILQALLENPQLHIADRTVEIQHDRAKIALSNFLPHLIGFAGFTSTSNSFVFDKSYWMGGLAGVLTVFNGFANVNEYKAARERKKEAMVQREELCLTIMLQVIKAHLNLQDIQEELVLAQKKFEVVSDRLNEIKAKWEEGIIKPSEKLQAIAELDRAQREVMKTRFQQQVSIATLLNAIGKSYGISK